MKSSYFDTKTVECICFNGENDKINPGEASSCAWSIKATKFKEIKPPQHYYRQKSIYATSDLGRLVNDFPTIPSSLLIPFTFLSTSQISTFSFWPYGYTVLNLSNHSVSLFLLRTASTRPIAPWLVLPLPCHFSIICTEYLAFLHIPVEKRSDGYLQEFDFSFHLKLAPCVANLIFSC